MHEYQKRLRGRLNHVKENDLAHGEFTEWVEKSLDINYKEAQRFMKVANELPEWTTLSNLGNQTLYLIATLPEPDTHGNNLLNNEKTQKNSTTRADYS